MTLVSEIVLVWQVPIHERNRVDFIVEHQHDSQENASGIRKVVTRLPQQPLSPPYELRNEMIWRDFSSIENPCGTPKMLVSAMGEAIAAGEAGFAPDRDAHSLRTALARRFSLPVNAFLCGTSVNDIIRAIAQTYKPCTVGITIPCPVEYALAIGNAGHTIAEISGPTGFIAPDPAFARERGVQFQAALLANPSFPASRLLPKQTVIRYLQSCNWVIVDEELIELTLGGETLLPLVEQYRNLIVVRSLSKTYALGGIPISYCVAHPETIKQIRKFYDSSATSMFGEVLSGLLAETDAYLDQTRELLESEIPWMQCMLSLIPGITIFPAEANFVMCRFDNDGSLDLAIDDLSELCLKLQLSGFLIRPIEGVPGLANNRYFTVAIHDRVENEKLVIAMRHIIVKNS